MSGPNELLASEIQGYSSMVISEHPASEYAVIGTRPIRHDGLDKVTGRAVYGADIRLSGLVYGAVLRSPYPHARIVSIDTSKAEAAAGVLAIMTGADVPGTGPDADRVMAGPKAVYRGHPVAAVAATSLNLAQEAVDLIEVEYEKLQPILGITEAMSPDSDIIHPDFRGDHLGESVGNTNVSTHLRYVAGDTEKGFEESEVVVEREVELATVHQGYIEPHSGTALWDENGRVNVWTSTQGIFGVRDSVAKILELPQSGVVVEPLEIGGGFGGKLSIYLEPLAAILSKKCGRPVKMYMDRKSVFESTGPAAAAIVKIKMGVDGNGRIRAAQADLRYDAGAYPGSPVQAGAVCCFAAYDIPNVLIDGYAVMTTKPRTSAYRAPGSTHVAYGVEVVVDEICKEIGMDLFEFRLLNASHEGGRRADGPLWGPIGTRQVLETARASDHWNSPINNSGNGKLRGRGVATGFWRNAGRRSSVDLAVNDDGTVALTEGSVDIGGTRAAIAMQAAEVLGIPAESIIPSVVNTDSIGYTDSTGGSRTCYATGFAAYEAAQMVVAEMKLRAAMLWEIDEGDIQYMCGIYSSISDPELRISFKDLAGRLGGTGGPVTAAASVDVSEAGGAFATHIVDLEVDPDTGKTDVVRFTAVQDVGKAIHPAYVEGQMQGGAVQGIGWALNEEYVLDDEGVMKNSSFLDYRMPTTYDLPSIDTILVEVGNPIHPYGVRGVGEVPIAPPVAAISNALYDATGHRFTTSPMHPGRILEAMGKLGPGNSKG